MKKIVYTLMALAILTVPALAGTNYDVCFTPLDADGNGVMSKGEFLVAFSDGDMAVFDTADADKDGSISHDEWEEYKVAQGFE